MILETKRTRLRRMTEEDLPALREILQDPVAMAAYEHAFSKQEVRQWLNNQQERYARYGMGLWAVCLKETGRMIGQCGLTYQDVGLGEPVLEVGYLFNRRYWHRGYAVETARACRNWAFEHTAAQKVYSVIRDTNSASRHVAIRNGMSRESGMVKQYYGMEMPHDLYRITRQEWLRVTGQAGGRELWDLYDAQRRPVGRTIPRRGKLPQGCYHLGVRIVVTDGRGNVLLVHSVKRKGPYTNAWECPGGAVIAGEDSLRGAQRELCEETGIAVDESELHFLASSTVGSCHHDNYLVVRPVPLRALRFQPGETDRARWVPFQEFAAMPAGRMPRPEVRCRMEQELRWKKLLGL